MPYSALGLSKDILQELIFSKAVFKRYLLGEWLLELPICWQRQYHKDRNSKNALIGGRDFLMNVNPMSIFDFQSLPNFEGTSPSLKQFSARDGIALSYRLVNEFNGFKGATHGFFENIEQYNEGFT